MVKYDIDVTGNPYVKRLHIGQLSKDDANGEWQGSEPDEEHLPEPVEYDQEVSEA